MPLISIIVPVYNTKERLKECLDSLIRQTYTNIEIIIIDDGSNDGSEKICDEYSKKDPRIKTTHIVNSGVSVARNIGMQNSNAPYIMFVDSDDIVKDTLTEELITKTVSEDLDFTMCGYERVFIQDNKIQNVQYVLCKSYTGNIIGFLHDLKHYINIPLLQGPCWKLFKKNIILKNNIKFPETMSYGEDTVFVYEYLIYVEKIGTIAKELYQYNIYGYKSLSRVFRKDKYEINLFLVKKLEDLLRNHDVNINTSVSENQICNAYISYMGDMFRNWNKIEKRRRYQYILEASKLTETKEAFKNLSDVSWQHKILDKLINNNKTSGINVYFILKNFFRTILSHLTNQL